MRDILEYAVDTTVDDELGFRITHQSPLIAKFFALLSALGKDSFLTNSGYKIGIKDIPEFKVTSNSIYLRGKKSRFNQKLDITRFRTKSYRDKTLKTFKKAMSEFSNAVATADQKGLLDGYTTYVTYGNVKRFLGGGNPLANLNAPLYLPQIQSTLSNNLNRFMGRRNACVESYNMIPIAFYGDHDYEPMRKIEIISL